MVTIKGGGRKRSLRCTPPVVLVCALAASAALGCDSRHPSQVSQQRRPELYEARPDPPPITPPSNAESAASKDKDGPAGLLQGTEVTSKPEMPAGLEKLDIANARRTGAVTVEVNDSQFVSRLDQLFDGNPSTLSRTEEVNPLMLTFRFTSAIRLKSVRLYPSYSSYDWRLDAAPGGPSRIVRGAQADTWSGIELEHATETTMVRLFLRRLERDNFVHVNEVEIWTAPSGRSTTPRTGPATD